MAVANITGFSVGQDLQTVIFQNETTSSTINATQLGRLLEFNANPQITELSMTPVNNGGVQLTRNIYHGWDGEITFGRYNGTLANLMSGIMAVFNQQGYESYFTITAVVLNTVDSSVDYYTFPHCVISQVGTGDFGGNKEVNQRLRFRGQQVLPGNNPAYASAPIS